MNISGLTGITGSNQPSYARTPTYIIRENVSKLAVAFTWSPNEREILAGEGQKPARPGQFQVLASGWPTLKGIPRSVSLKFIAMILKHQLLFR